MQLRKYLDLTDFAYFPSLSGPWMVFVINSEVDFSLCNAQFGANLRPWIILASWLENRLLVGKSAGKLDLQIFAHRRMLIRSYKLDIPQTEMPGLICGALALTRRRKKFPGICVIGPF